MVDISYLQKRGVSSGAYKKIFTHEPSKYPTKIKKLVEIISSRIRDGFTLNLSEHRAYYAVDLAYEVPFNQTTPTFVHHILSQNLNAEQTLEALKKWGLSESELFLDVPLGDGKMGKLLNVPVFYQIYIPIVKAYVNAIAEQIYNERNVNPLLRYNPLKNTDRNQMLCEIITDLVQTMSTWYGYPSTLRQSIQQMLKYGIMLAFPREEWHCETQVVDFGNGEEEITVKEGLRYTHPHPTRMFYDLEYPLTSLNTDTGCTFAGHWHILSYGSILDNRMYWNRKNIFMGTNWFQSPLAGNYFTEVFPCQLKFPGTGFAPLGREDKMAWYNSSQDRDKAVFVTELFMKIVPDDWELTDRTKKGQGYKYPVWHRFTVAGDDTIIWAEPCAYNPVWFMGYDYDEQAARTSSLGLEIIPWQDHLGNILSQMLLTAKQNLINVIFYDTNLVDKHDIEKLQNAGERKYRSVEFIPYDSFKNAAARLEMRNAFTPVQLTKTQIVDLLQMIPTVLNIMQRVLRISAQASGSSATHQQSKEEVVQTGSATDNRINYLSASVDEGVDAWKRQLYESSQSYADTKFLAEVSSDVENIDQHLDELGFKVKGKTKDSVVVEGQRHNLRLEGFAAANQGPAKNANREMAQIIFQTVGTVAGQEDLHKAIGAKNLLKLIEQAALIAGAPRDFRLKLDTEGKKDEEIPPMIIQAIQTAQAATLKQINEQVTQPIAKEISTDQQQLAQIQESLKQLQGIFDVAKKLTQKNQAEQEKAQVKAQIDIQKAQTDDALKQQAAQAEARRAEERHQTELRREAEKANLDRQIEVEKAKTEIEIKKRESAEKPKQTPAE